MQINGNKYSCVSVHNATDVSQREMLVNSNDKIINFDSKYYDFAPFFEELKDLNSKIKNMAIEEDRDGCKVIILKTSDMPFDERSELIDKSCIKLRNYGKNIGMGGLIDFCYVFVDVEE